MFSHSITFAGQIDINTYMRRIIVIIAVFIFIGLNVFASEETDSTKLTYENAISFAPLNLADVFKPSVSLSFERFLSARHSIQLEMKILIPFYYFGKRMTSYNGADLRLEYRFNYKSSKHERCNPYIAVQALYQTYRGNGLVDDLYEFYREGFKAGGNLKLGLTHDLNKDNTLFLDYYIGIGFTYFDFTKEYLNDFTNRDFFPTLMLSAREGTGFMRYVPANIKVGYRF